MSARCESRLAPGRALGGRLKRRWRHPAALLAAALFGGGCDTQRADTDPGKQATVPVELTPATGDGTSTSSSPQEAPDLAPWRTASREPPVATGMVWIEPGTLIAGTPPERVPRKADREMPGEQVVLQGFYIDQYAHPNEQGAIPTTNVSQDEARALCEEQGKRLCSELEWERACKGPRNLTYEYGDAYQSGICETGGHPRILPSGYRFGCRSEFNVFDLHGSLWEWTDSRWGRGESRVWATLRGGNGPDGEVVGRCANARGVPPATKSRTIGFRCCSGPRNAAEVSLTLDDGAALHLVPRPDRALMTALEAKLPDALQSEMKRYGLFRFTRLWEWKPIPNEDLLLAGGCAGAAPRRRCGVLVVRRSLGRLDRLEWVSSGHFVPTVKMKHEARKLWLYGGDQRSHFRTRVDFDWGTLKVAAPERNIKR